MKSISIYVLIPNTATYCETAIEYSTLFAQKFLADMTRSKVGKSKVLNMWTGLNA